ncbi:MAG: Y4bD/Y4pK family protein [Actinobacteria bacterium]|nr:Y4bD/Y4pK family protein [Actinomycetota bacterium]MCA1699617.1 Y4bD/Y4pK family protein [Actinomycetota bacterium]
MVTHPFHPLRGERLVVLFVRRIGAARVYVCEGGPLGSVGLPEDATDRGPEPAERPLSIEVLGALVALVADLGGEQEVAR